MYKRALNEVSDIMKWYSYLPTYKYNLFYIVPTCAADYIQHFKRGIKGIIPILFYLMTVESLHLYFKKLKNIV